MLPGMNDLWNTDGLPPAERAVYIAHLRSAMRAAYEHLGFGLQAVLAAVDLSDLPTVAKAMGVSPAVAVRMATDTDAPDVALMLRGFKIVKRRPNLPVNVITRANEARHITGASDADITKIARLLVEVSKIVPLDHEVWAGAKPDDKIVFHQAVTYARSLTN
jgi:hypothetical protein